MLCSQSFRRIGERHKFKVITVNVVSFPVARFVACDDLIDAIFGTEEIHDDFSRVVRAHHTAFFVQYLMPGAFTLQRCQAALDVKSALVMPMAGSKSHHLTMRNGESANPCSAYLDEASRQERSSIRWRAVTPQPPVRWSEVRGR